MEFLDKFVPQYEEMILLRKKIYMKKRPMVLKTVGVLFLLVAAVFGIGWVFSLLQNIGYLFTSSIIVFLVTYSTYKILVEKEYIVQTEESHPIWFVIVFDCLYMFVTFISATTLLYFSVYLRVLSPFLGTVYIVLMIVSVVFYAIAYKRINVLDMPSPIMLLLNGFFLAVLFYAMTLVIHINNIGLSLLIVFPAIFVLIRFKQYLEERFIIRISRYVIVFGGLFLIVLSFPFNKAITYPSVVRAEFTFRIIYETLINPENEFPKEVQGEALFFDDYIVVVDDENITFYDDELTLVKTYNNNYDAVYILNGRLLANQVPGTPTPYIKLYEYKADNFELIGSYYVKDPTDKVYIDEDVYLSLGGTIYIKEPDNDEYVQLEREVTPVPTILEQHENYMVFRYEVPILAATDSFREIVSGYIFENIATHNDHIAFVYSNVYVVRNPLLVDPRDNGKIILYLADTDEYFNDVTIMPASFEMPHLFRINQFYYIDNHYYLVGHVEYSTGDFNYKILILNEQGELERELVYDGPNVAVSDDYIMYGNEDSIKLFSIHADTTLRYRLIFGYGITFGTIAIVALFALDTLNPSPRKKIEFTVKKGKLQEIE